MTWTLRGHIVDTCVDTHSPVPPIRCVHATSPGGRHMAPSARLMCHRRRRPVCQPVEKEKIGRALSAA